MYINPALMHNCDVRKSPELPLCCSSTQSHSSNHLYTSTCCQVLRPEGTEAAADTQQAAALAALKAAGGASSGQKVVLQGNGNADSDFHALRAAFDVVSPPAGCADIVPSSGSQRLSQLLAQVNLQWLSLAIT